MWIQNCWGGTSGGSRICRRGGGSWRGRMGVPYLGGGGVRRVRPMVATSLSRPFYRFMVLGGGGGG